MEKIQKKSALIAGGGVAGLAAAVLLDEQGYAVTLVEKKPILGGRTFSFTDPKTGAVLDNGQHLLIGAYHETLTLLEKVGAKSRVQMKIPTVVPLDFGEGRRGDFTVSSLPPPLGLLGAVLRFTHFSWAEKWQILKLGLALKKIKSLKIPHPKNLTVREWLLQNGQSENLIKNFWSILVLATINDSMDVVCADLLVEVLLRGYFAGPRDGFLVFPRAGLSEVLVEPVRRYLEMRGQNVVTGLGLKEVKILNNRVQGFVMGDGNMKTADLYVCALPPYRLMNVLPKPFVDQHPDLSAVKDFSFSPIVSINLFYDQDHMPDEFIGSSSTVVHWFFNRNQIAIQSSSGTHIVGVVSGAHDLLNKSKDELIALACKDLETLYPGFKKSRLEHALVNIERQATVSFSPKSAGQRPKQKILENFFVIGDWTDTGLPATIESAVLSACQIQATLA